MSYPGLKTSRLMVTATSITQTPKRLGQLHFTLVLSSLLLSNTSVYTNTNDALLLSIAENVQRRTPW